VPLKDLLGAVTMGVQDEDLFTSLANRLIRLQRQLTEDEKARFEKLSNGKTINQAAGDLLNAYNPDTIENVRLKIEQEKAGQAPAEIKETIQKELNALRRRAASTFTGQVNEYIENVRKVHEQIIDIVNPDKIKKAEWDCYFTDKAREVVRDFTSYIEANRDEIIALSIFYDQPYRRRELTFSMTKEVLEILKREKPLLAPHYVWDAYAQLEEVRGDSPKSELAALVSLIRRVTGIDRQLTPYNHIVDRNFKDWIFKKHGGAGQKFTEEQMEWLRLIKDHVAASFHVAADDLDYTPFDALGGRGRMWQLFGDRASELLDELNEALAA
jgi:type I restriction enzyme R subunit